MTTGKRRERAAVLFNVSTAPTRYDVNFRLFGVPVTINPWYWVLLLLFGCRLLERGNGAAFVIFATAATASLLVHEFGHVLAFRRYGVGSRIMLLGTGGLAIPNGTPSTRRRRVAVALAGPAAGFLLLGLVVGLHELTDWGDPARPYAAKLYSQFYFINLFWNLLNLAPVMPLDGGRVCWEACHATVRRDAERVCYGIGIVFAGTLAVHALLGHFAGKPFLPYVPYGPFMGIFFALLAVQNYQLYRTARRPTVYWEDSDLPPWRR